MAKNERTIMVKKIPLGELIPFLINIYEDGVDFVDMVGSTGKDFDVLKFIVNEDYLEGGERIDDTLLENDINNLIV